MYGIRITPKDTGIPYVFDENTMFISNLGSGITSRFVLTYNTGIQIPENYTPIVTLGEEFQYDGFVTRSFRLTANRTVELYSIGTTDSYYGMNRTTWKVQAIPSSRKASYGIAITGNTRFTSLPTSTYVTNLLYRGETEVYTNWSPSVVYPAYNSNCTCFLYLAPNNFHIVSLAQLGDAIRLFINGTTNYNHGARVKAKVVIFGPKTLQKGYGINIYAADGSLAFTSGESSICTGKLFKPRLEKFSVEGINYPMVGLPSSDIAVGPSRTYSLMNDGMYLTPRYTTWVNRWNSSRTSSLDLLTIDAGDYFKNPDIFN